MTDHGYAVVEYLPGSGVGDYIHGPYLSDGECADEIDFMLGRDGRRPSRYVVVRLVAVSDD